MEFKLDKPKELFERHLGLPDNKRIIFSGAFGSGKTYFLDKFFKDDEKYEAIHLFPVNYSVASNEDIFELIKYDILFSLLEKGVKLEEVAIERSAFLPYFLKNHSSEILPLLLGIIPKVGGSLEKIAKNLISLKKKFDEEYAEANLGDKENIITYLQGFTNTKGNLYEEDLFTQLISKLAGQLKERNEGNGIKKETVLIIDDLDRIDPEHIFRIFNVLAAHVDIRKDQNKFDFDRIILVCDIENIRRIFSNRYGMDVDFSGYIDKFYSRSIFYYDLSLEIINRFNKVVESLPDLNLICAEYTDNVKFILLSFLQYNLLPVRALLRTMNMESPIRIREFWNEGMHNKVSNEDIQLVLTIDFLRNIYPDLETLIENCKRLIGKDLKNQLNISLELLISQLVEAVSYKDYYTYKDYYKNTREKEDQKVPKACISGYRFEYRIDRKPQPNNPAKDYYSFCIESTHDSDGSSVNLEDLDYFQLLASVLEESEFGKLMESQKQFSS